MLSEQVLDLSGLTVLRPDWQHDLGLTAAELPLCVRLVSDMTLWFSTAVGVYCPSVFD